MSKLEYNPKAAEAIGFLKKHHNDVEIYVEDTAVPNVWNKIIANILPEKIKFKSVTGMGGRLGVLKACEMNQIQKNRKKLFIIDGDYDFLLRKPTPKMKHLYRIQAFCVENIILKEEALIEALYGPSESDSRAEIREKLYSGGEFINGVESVERLYRAYAAGFDVCPSIENKNYSSYKLMKSSKSSYLGYYNRLVDGRLQSYLGECASVTSKLRIQKKYNAVSERKVAFDKRICGKDVILPVVYGKAQKYCRFQGRKENLQSLVAGYFKPEYEPNLAKRLRSL